MHFFFEPGEDRTTSGTGPHVVRVGTRAIDYRSTRKLWDRLRKHRGRTAGRGANGGDHRASVFREHVSAAFIRREGFACPSWGDKSAPRDVRGSERAIECQVSGHIRSMPFVWLDVSGGDDGGRAQRKRIEANAIGLLSNAGMLGAPATIDPPSLPWLGTHSGNVRVRESGLWNVRHVDDDYDAAFLDELSQLIQA